MNILYKNVASQKAMVVGWDTSTDPWSRLTGDAANITANISKDGGAETGTNDTNPTEIGTTGVYLFDLTQAESNADLVLINPSSTTGNTLFLPVEYRTIPGDNVALAADAILISGATPDSLQDYIDGVVAGLLGYFQLLARSDAGIATDRATELAAINTDEGSGVGGFANTTDSQQGTYDALETHDIAVTAGVTVATVGTGAITAASFAANAVDAAALATDAAQEIRNAILSDQTPFAGANIDAAVSTRATPAQVNTEVLDVLNTDTFAEPSSVPGATTTIVNMIHWGYTLSRNKKTQTATTSVLRNDADGANIGSKTVSDDGTTYTSGEWA